MVEQPENARITMPDNALTSEQDDLRAKQADVTSVNVEDDSGWEEDLLAAAEGRAEFPDPNQEDKDQEEAVLVLRHQVLSLRSNSSASRRKIKSPRTATVRYTPTEKYWLNRTYRLYRSQQAVQKLAKSRNIPYHPPEGILTHQNMMDKFNDRFADKSVDGIGPRPKRERHAFGLWSAKYMRENDGAMSGAVPDYWMLERKKRPEWISLEEDVGRQWDCDEYLDVRAEPGYPKSPQSRKKRKIAAEPSEGVDLAKKARLAIVVSDVEDSSAFGEDESLESGNIRPYPSHTHRRRYSAPILGGPRQKSHLAHDHGDFGYSWSQAKAEIAWREKHRKVVARRVETALNAM